MARQHRGRRAELVDPGCAGRRAIEALLDAVAGALNLWKGQVDLSNDTGHVEPASVADAALVLRVQAWAELLHAAHGQ